MKAFFFQNAHMTHGAFCHAFRRGMSSVFLQKIFRERPRINPDPDRHMDLPGHFHDFDYIFPASDISRVDAQRVDPRFHGGERQAVIKMDVRHQRRVRHLLQVFQRFRRFPVRHSHPDDIRARFFQRIDLRRRV